MYKLFRCLATVLMVCCLVRPAFAQTTVVHPTEFKNGIRLVPQVPPASPTEGQVYQSQTDHLFYIFNGTSYVKVGATSEAELVFTDLTTANSSTLKHGLLPKLDNTVTHFLNGQGAWTVPTIASSVPLDQTVTTKPDCGFGICGNFNPISTPTATDVGGVSGYANYAATAADGSDTVYGGRFSSDYSGSGDLATLIGVRGKTQTYGSGTVTNLIGADFVVNNFSGGAVTAARGVSSVFLNDGGTPYSTVYGFYNRLSIQSATSLYGAYIDLPTVNSGTPTNKVGVYIEDWSGGAGTNEYNFWSAGAASVNRFDGSINLGANKVFSAVAPTIASGFGGTPSIVAGGTATSFRVNVGTGGSATAGVITMPTAANAWNCHVNDLTAAAAHVAYNTRQTASTVSSVTVENQTTSTGAAIAWAASDILTLLCGAN